MPVVGMKGDLGASSDALTFSYMLLGKASSIRALHWIEKDEAGWDDLVSELNYDSDVQIIKYKVENNKLTFLSGDLASLEFIKQ